MKNYVQMERENDFGPSWLNSSTDETVYPLAVLKETRFRYLQLALFSILPSTVFRLLQKRGVDHNWAECQTFVPFPSTNFFSPPSFSVFDWQKMDAF